MKEYRYKNITLKISAEVLNIMELNIQDASKKNEAGGIVLGQIKDDTVFLLKASIPTSFDKASRYGFERNKDIAQIIVNYEFLNSNKKTIYFGEWHTHPENKPTPSGQDRKMISEQFKLNKNIESFIFLLIQGIKSLYVGVYIGKELKVMDEIK